MTAPADPRPLLDALVREQSGQLVATLTRLLGASQLDLVHDCVQDALLQALRVWSFEGVPERPGAWLAQVARNRALDLLRRARTVAAKQPQLERWAARVAAAAERSAAAPPAADDDRAPADDTLHLMLLCCHPALAPDSRVALTLHCAAGFTVAEIARALLCDERAIEQRLVRAKRTLRGLDVPFALPRRAELATRLDALLDVVYLLFNEGYAATGGDELLRGDLVREALRLGTLLAAHPATTSPRVHALAALLLLQAARLPATHDATGELRLLADQPRAEFDAAARARGFWHLARAAAGDELTRFHHEAAIAALHAGAPSHRATDWAQIVWHYDRLLELDGSPIHALHRAIALGNAAGPAAALAALEPLAREPRLRRHPTLPAARAEFLARADRRTEAVDALREAIRHSRNRAQRRWLEQRADLLARRTR
ncbi:MAG: sigma-70 family RNA polymerase sigma factor [Planctomycetes bacterium]|nr:sigma-70 family RNA polymerase sigma factor [Planctomycetota bacterium]